MKKILIALIAFGFFSCSYTGVKQEPMNLGSATLVTRLMYEGEEIAVYFDELDNEKIDSIAKERVRKGYLIIKRIDRIKERKSDYK
jgi:hypothetical protein